ncbi:MAG: hypothetical protein K940chlam8_00440, partial [Chlamydiae bacterium]|nr:hypothetical protein [Chlamydiota bacterium]
KTHLPKTHTIQDAIHSQQNSFSSIQRLEDENQVFITMIFPIDNQSALLITFFANMLDRTLRLFLFTALWVGIILAIIALIFLFYLAKTLTKPLKQLNLKAQEIISGGRVEKVYGFEEITDLDLSLDTCHEMLKEQGKLLKQNAFLQQKEHFDVQLGTFLENYLFLDPLQNVRSNFIKLNAFELFSNTPFGTKAQIKDSSKKWSLLLFDALDSGLKPILELLKTTTTSTFEMHIEKAKRLVTIKGTQYKAYIFTKNRFKKIENGTLKKGIFVIFDQGIIKLAKTQKQVLGLVEKILKEFEDQGLDLCIKMIQKEFELLEQKRVLEKDAKMILGKLQ